MKRLTKVGLLALCLTPVLWLWKRPETLIDGSDTNFPLNLGSWITRRLFVWQSIANAGSDFSSSTSGLFFHFIQFVPFKLGLNLQQVQLVSLVFWFSTVVVGAFILARTIFPKKSLVQFLFSIFYAYNTYLFNTWENVKVTNLALVSAIPLTLAILINLKEKRIRPTQAIFFSSLVGIILSGTGINPAYWVALFVIIIGYVIFEMSFVSLKNFLLVSSILILTNAFWIIPSANFIVKNVGAFGSIDKIGYANWIDSLSEHTSILNILRLQGAWDWYSFDSLNQFPIYIPYALNYFFSLPFIIFSFLIPSLAIVSLIWRDDSKKRLYLFFGTLILTGVLMGAGTHLPSGAIFRLLVNKLPFFSLFRSPWYIFAPMITLGYAGLIGLLFNHLDERSPRLSSLIMVILIFGNLVYNYPLVTGKIFRPSLSDNFYIKFPDYVFQTQKWLASQDFSKTGRIINYPSDEIERFTWGYNGIDSILGLISSAEMFFSPLNAPNNGVSRILQETYKNMQIGQWEGTKNLFTKLGAGMIFNKHDQNSLAPPLSTAMMAEKVKNFGYWDFYRFPTADQFVPKIFSPTQTFFGYPYTEAPKLLSVLPGKSILVNSEDTAINTNPLIGTTAGEIILTQNSQAEELKNYKASTHATASRLQIRNLSSVDFTFTILKNESYRPILERHNLESFGLLLKDSLIVNQDGIDTTWKIDYMTDSYVYFLPILLRVGKHKVIFHLETLDHIQNGNFEQGLDFQKIGGADFNIVDNFSNHFLMIFNRDKSAPEPAAKFQVSKFDPFSTYLFTLKYRWFFGNVAQVVADQMNERGALKTVVESLPKSPEWENYSFYFTPFEYGPKLSINLIAPFISDSSGTKVAYDDLHAYEVFSQNLFLVKEGLTIDNTPDVNFVQKSPSLYSGQVSNVRGPHVLTFLENYSPDWSLRIYGKNNQQFLPHPVHFSVNSYANAWYINVPAERYNFEIYYTPQNLHNLGAVISCLTVLLAALAICLKK